MVSPVGFVEIEVRDFIFGHQFHYGKVSIAANNVEKIEIVDRFDETFTHSPMFG
jgi:hypothetical protein